MNLTNLQKPALVAMTSVLALTLATVPAPAQERVPGPVNYEQSSVTATDIQRLQDQLYDANNEVARLRSRDQAAFDRLQTKLDDVRDEVIYLRVKMRKEGSVSRRDYNDVRSQVESVRSEARGNTTRDNTAPTRDNDPVRQGSATWPTGGTGSGSGTGYGTGTSGSTQPRRNEVPAGAEIDVRLERELSSSTAQVEDRFTATTAVDLYQGNDVLIPAGSVLRGVVSSVNKATRTDRKGSLTVAFDQISVRGRSYPIHATVTQALESEGIKGEAGKIGAGAGVGAIIGGILGGTKGALLGILIGGGGTIAATEGKDVALPAGSVLRVKFDSPLVIR